MSVTTASRIYELLVRTAPNADSPRNLHDKHVGVFVTNRHSRYLLPREGDLAAEIDARLFDHRDGSTATERVDAVAGWLKIERGATVVLPVWAYDHDQLRFSAGERLGNAADPWHSVLAGVIYDTPATRERSGVAPEAIEQALRTEVRDYDRWTNGEVFEYVLTYEEGDDWELVDGATYYDHTEARRAGEARWRQLVGPLYTEAEPLGPCEVGDAGGEAQLSAAYSRRFVRKLTDGVRWGVIDIECYVLNANPNIEPPELVLTHHFGYTVCTDPTDPLGSEEMSDSRDFDIPLRPGQATLSDETVRRICARLDPAQLDWDGERIW